MPDHQPGFPIEIPPARIRILLYFVLRDTFWIYALCIAVAVLLALLGACLIALEGSPLCIACFAWSAIFAGLSVRAGARWRSYKNGRYPSEEVPVE